MNKKVIVFINPDDVEKMEIATDDFGNRLIFNSHEEAEHWCLENAVAGNSYMHWDGER